MISSRGAVLYTIYLFYLWQNYIKNCRLGIAELKSITATWGWSEAVRHMFLHRCCLLMTWLQCCGWKGSSSTHNCRVSDRTKGYTCCECAVSSTHPQLISLTASGLHQCKVCRKTWRRQKNAKHTYYWLLEPLERLNPRLSDFHLRIPADQERRCSMDTYNWT